MYAFAKASITTSLLIAGALAIGAPAPAQARDGVVAGLAAGALAGVAAGAILSAPRPAPYYGPVVVDDPPPPVEYGPPCYFENHRVWDPYRGYISSSASESATERGFS